MSRPFSPFYRYVFFIAFFRILFWTTLNFVTEIPYKMTSPLSADSCVSDCPLTAIIRGIGVTTEFVLHLWKDAAQCENPAIEALVTDGIDCWAASLTNDAVDQMKQQLCVTGSFWTFLLASINNDGASLNFAWDLPSSLTIRNVSPRQSAAARIPLRPYFKGFGTLLFSLASSNVKLQRRIAEVVRKGDDHGPLTGKGETSCTTKARPTPIPGMSLINPGSRKRKPSVGFTFLNKKLD